MNNFAFSTNQYPLMRRNNIEFDENVQRIDDMKLHKYKLEFAESLVDRNYIKPDFFTPLKECENALKNVFLMQSERDFDFDWYNASVNYTLGLSNSDKYILRGYTRNGDELINALIRYPNNYLSDKMDIIRRKIYNNENNIIAVQLFKKHGLNPDNYIQDNLLISQQGFILLQGYVSTLTHQELIGHIYELINDMRRIIEAAPKPIKVIRVYRGVKEDYIKDNDVEYNLLSGFQSASYSIDVALGFSGQYNINDNITNNRHLMIYTLDVGTDIPCIAMEGISHFPQEKEILIDMNLYGNFMNYFLEKTHLHRGNLQFNELVPRAYPHTSIYNKIIQLMYIPYASMPSVLNRGFISRNARHSISSANTASEPSITESVINAALNEYEYNHYGGRLAIENAPRVNINRSITRKINNRRKLNKIEIHRTLKNNGTKQNNKRKMNYSEYLNIQKKESSQDYRKVRDPGIGFIIVKDKKVPKTVINAFKKLNSNK
jgi:hypothetical protein